MVYPDAVDVREPEQFNFGAEIFKNQQESLEQDSLANFSMEGTRLYDPLVKTICFGPKNTPLATKI